MLDLVRHRLNDAACEQRVAHERSSVTLACDLACRAAHVHIEGEDRVPEHLLEFVSFLRHRLWFMTEDLNGHLLLRGGKHEQIARLATAVAECLRGDHFGIGELCASFDAEFTKHLIGHTGHRCKNKASILEQVFHLVRTVRSFVDFENSHEGFLGHFDAADALHALLALLLLLEQLALTRDVAAIAFGEHVLAHRTHGLTREHA